MITGGGLLIDEPPLPPGSMIVVPPVFPAPPPPCDDAPELAVALQATDVDATRSRLSDPAVRNPPRAPSDSRAGGDVSGHPRVLLVFEKIAIEATLCPGVDELVELHESLTRAAWLPTPSRRQR